MALSDRQAERHVVRAIAGIGLVAAGYVLAAAVARCVALAPVTPVWPPSGFALAALLVGGRRLWPGVFLGVVLSVGPQLSPLPVPVELPPLGTLAMALGNTAEAVLGVTVLRRLRFSAGRLDTVRETLALLTVPAFLGAPVSATVGTFTLLAIGAASPDTAPDVWWTWWVGNVLGVIVFTPFLIAWLAWPPPRIPRVEPCRVVEGLALVAGGGFSAVHAIVGIFPHIPRNFREAYLLFPFLIWTALRFGPRAVATAIFSVGLVVLLSVESGRLGDPALPETTLPVQVFLGVMAGTILLLAAAVAERRRDYEELCQLKLHLEDQVRGRTAELESSNRDLEAFASRVSHDLRAPLRAVSGFTSLVLREHAEALPKEAQALLRRVEDRAGHMTRLVESLLGYARVGRGRPTLEDVDVDALVRGVIAELAPARREEIVLGELGHARADPLMLRQAFANLIENALKYSRDRTPPRVEVGRGREDGHPAWFVRDNGVGFDMRDAGKLFRVFSRLHGSEFEGTGVGLATVQRIVELHGGRVWAESAPGEGATFWFTLGVG